MIGRARRMWSRLDPSEENLAVDVIDEVARASIRGEGPTIYLKHPHTARNFRDSLYLPPRFIERRSLDPDRPTERLLDRLNADVEEILAADEAPTLSEEIAQRLRSEFA